MGMSPEELMEKLKASKQLIRETEGIRSVNGQLVKEKSKSKPRKQVIEEDFDPTPFTVDKSNVDDEYLTEIPSKTTNYQSTSVSSGKLTEKQRIKNLEKLPESIRKAMIETPIPQIKNVSIFDDSIINEIANDGKDNLIEEQDDIITTKNIKPKTQKNVSESFDYSKIISIIEEVVDRKIKDYYDSKLVSENVQIRVGNTVFSGNLKPLPKKVK
jgi:dihydroneopterin aldolase